MNYIDIEKDINIITNTNNHDIHNKHISVLIPLYNGIEFLEQSVSSVIRQTYKNWELIIGINGHPESSVVEQEAKEIIKKLDQDDKYNITVKYLNVVGKSKALNEMVKYCKYEYIAILDVDDYWEDTKLEIQTPFLGEYDVVGSKCEYFGDKTGSPPIPLGDFTHSHNIFDWNPVINSSAIINKRDAIWDDEKYVKPVVGLEDYSLWFRLFFLKRKFYNVDKILCYHRVHKASAFNNSNNNDVNELKKLWYEYYTTYKN